MAGTLTISQLSDGTNSTSSTNCIQGSAKAWVNFNGNGPVIRAAFNVSSITRNSSDSYNVNFSTPMLDANYCVSGAHNEENLYAGAFCPSVYATSYVTVRTVSYNEANGATPTYVNVTVHR